LDAEGRSADLDYGYLAFGYNTDPDVVAARNTVATYSGPVDFGLFADSISVASGTPEIVLSADFSTNRISGAIDGSLEKGRLLYDVTLTMDPTDIEGNSFVSTFDIEVDGTVLSSVTSTAIEGAFFGPNAEEIAEKTKAAPRHAVLPHPIPPRADLGRGHINRRPRQQRPARG